MTCSQRLIFLNQYHLKVAKHNITTQYKEDICDTNKLITECRNLQHFG